MLAAVLRLQQLGERGEKGPGSEGSVARAWGDRGLPRCGPSANTGMCWSGLHYIGYQQSYIYCRSLAYLIKINQLPRSILMGESLSGQKTEGAG